MHVRTAIRDQVYALLLPLVSGRVYKARLYPLAEAELPAILIWCGDEEIEDAGIMSPRQYDRRMQLFIEIRASVSDDLDATLNAIALDVEKALAPDPQLAGTAFDVALVSLAFQQSGDGKAPIGALRLEYAAIYRVTADAPEI